MYVWYLTIRLEYINHSNDAFVAIITVKMKQLAYNRDFIVLTTVAVD